MLNSSFHSYDQGVVGNVLPQQSFQAYFPAIATDAGRKGWMVSTLLLGRFPSLFFPSFLPSGLMK
jgi:hypothetical protein